MASPASVGTVALWLSRACPLLALLLARLAPWPPSTTAKAKGQEGRMRPSPQLSRLAVPDDLRSSSFPQNPVPPLALVPGPCLLGFPCLPRCLRPSLPGAPRAVLRPEPRFRAGRGNRLCRPRRGNPRVSVYPRLAPRAGFIAPLAPSSARARGDPQRLGVPFPGSQSPRAPAAHTTTPDSPIPPRRCRTPLLPAGRGCHVGPRPSWGVRPQSSIPLPHGPEPIWFPLLPSPVSSPVFGSLLLPTRPAHVTRVRSPCPRRPPGPSPALPARLPPVPTVPGPLFRRRASWRPTAPLRFLFPRPPALGPGGRSASVWKLLHLKCPGAAGKPHRPQCPPSQGAEDVENHVRQVEPGAQSEEPQGAPGPGEVGVGATTAATATGLILEKQKRARREGTRSRDPKEKPGAGAGDAWLRTWKGRQRGPESRRHLGPLSRLAMRPCASGPVARLLVLLLALLPRRARAREPSAQDVSLGVDWLTRYGYLPQPDPAQAQLQSLEKLRNAIKVMQRFAGLPETGRMDARTLATMHKPRCSLPDVMGVAGLVRRRRRYALSGSVWKKRTLTWRVHSFPQRSQLNQDTVRTLMQYALNAWGVESGLKFQELGPQDPEPDILIDFARAYHQDSYPFDGLGGTLAHAFFPGEHPISGDTHFDDEEAWTYGSRDGEGTDLFAVAVHEFGHALGLGHSSAPDSIMRPFYQGTVGHPSKYRLPHDDRDGLQQLYGKGPHTPHLEPTRKPLAPPPQPSLLPPDSPSSPVPDRCDGNFDAIANIRGETFFFKGPWFWRVQPSGQLVSPRPARLHRFWEGLPAQVKVIQAAYTRHQDGRILLFSGSRFWVFKDRRLEGSALPLTQLGLPAGEQVDAVFSWPLNGKTYLVRGQQYWRFDEAAASPDPGYPRSLSLWEGAPLAPDDVTISNAGDTYFFKGVHYWRFAKGSVVADPDSPRPMGPKWLDCPAPSGDTPKAPSRPEACNCHCEINQAAGPPLLRLLLPPLALLVWGALSC
ncbi:PREDICTED: matrix metalloproteinase-25 [Elephantulus edwardii]|uniref:matrix metalloproteinase-25 n=1 Tax=Elephantulus edwardii TaxID=28737 RepID=UPI0003F0EFF0|nr:PREDICTED: matrix metalloproteinase-25 [Elephantulus edwardii]